MPQGGRKVPFSGKAKKQQLQAKKGRKNEHTGGSRGHHGATAPDSDERGGSSEVHVQKLNQQPSTGRAGRNENRYVLQFREDSKEEIARRRELARRALNFLPETALEIDPEEPFPEGLDFPKRPPWDFSMSRDVLEAREQKYFREYIDCLSRRFDFSELSYFEMNLETWRQLWRVLELSDVILMIVDIRFPVYMFPPMLYNYVTGTLGKSMVLVLNKVDLAPAPLVLAWKHFFLSRYPSLQVLLFTSFPGYNLRNNSTNAGGLQVRRRRGKLRMAAEGAQELLQACEKIVGDKVDLSSWHKKIADELNTEYEDDGLEIEDTIEMSKVDTSFVEQERFIGGVLTIGCIGQPNTGKSSLMNAIMGKKVVSVSRTPGHTKHFQTIFLTPQVRLCDCPGLVFPSRVPKTIQVLMGSYPIAQLREPYSSVQYLTERLNLITLLRLQHPENDTVWSAFDVCEAWAKQRGFFTAKAARPDTYRAANHLLRMALDGKICLCLYPPNYTASKEKWAHHAGMQEVQWVQAKSKDGEKDEDLWDMDFADDDEGELQQASGGSCQPVQSIAVEDEEAGEESSESDEPIPVAGNKFALLGDE